MSLKKTAMKLAVGIMRAVYAPMKLQRVHNKITIISRQSNEPSMDIALLGDYLRETYPDTECVILCRHLESSNRLIYAAHMLRQMKHMASSQVVVIDGYCIAACVLKHRTELDVVQIWHAMAAIKKFGYQTIGRNSGRSRETAEIMCMHRNYDYITAPGKKTGDYFCQGFDADPDKLVFYALPRADVITAEDEELRRKVRKEYGVGDDQEMILYAPTFRKGSRVDVESLEKAIDRSRFSLIVKLHPLYDEDGRSDLRYSTYEWMKICDRIITDYSALGVEAAITGKPLYFYVYDMEEYERENGLNVNPLEEMPGASATEAGELARIMERRYDYDELRRFRDRYISADLTGCTKKLGDFIHGLTD